MPRESEIAEISQVFLSATAQDCNTYRQSIHKHVCDTLPTVKIHLQENWTGAASFVVDVCEKRVTSCDAYFGLFGYRYGWIPKGHTKSITELEFLWAISRWSQRDPPIFILLPEKNSKADRLLDKWAQEILKKEFSDEASRIDAISKQRSFLSQVKQWAAAEGRLLIYFQDENQLVYKALYCILNWNCDLLRKAYDSRRSVMGEIPAEELGRIGREKQMQALEKALEAFRNRNHERAVSFLVHGPENYGQREFAHFLHRWDDWENTQVFCGQASELDNIDSLICWACGQLQEPIAGIPSVESLSNVLISRFSRNSVVFIMRSLGRHTDRLTTFLDKLWKPLMDILASNLPSNKTRRLYWFIVDHEVLPDDYQQGIWRDDLDADNVNYQMFLPLPPLSNINTNDVKKWLKDLNKSKTISMDEEKRNTVAEFVTETGSIPANVYNRLALSGFWADSN